MSKIMLVDAAFPEEVRVAVVNGARLEEYASEVASRKSIKSNIYLAKVVRVEPSLQAAFVEYAGERHGFLPFNEIHPDYYQVPVADREKILTAAKKEVKEPLEGEDPIEEEEEAKERIPPKPPFHYKIQEVIKRRQIILVQVVKEERGNKGAALTTYLTLPGRYCVLMPNAHQRAGGVSRKISSTQDRERLKKMLQEFKVPETMSIIVRTAGESRTKGEIKRDYEYLMRVWGEIRATTLQSIAPALVYTEGDIIKRALRDSYNREIDKVLVEGEEAYKTARHFMKTMVPSHVKRVQLYENNIPIFQQYVLEEQIANMFLVKVKLPSGGSLVINTTEALTAIDVNSGKATKERHIDDTALKTNLEAAEEIAHQLRLREIAGLIVIDFIDMYDRKYNSKVEKRFREAIKQDRARIQVSNISEFGLLELSRQRLQPSLLESSTTICGHCEGKGVVHSVEAAALLALRALGMEGFKANNSDMIVSLPQQIGFYLLNYKRERLAYIENRYHTRIVIEYDPVLVPPQFSIKIVPQEIVKEEPARVEAKDEPAEAREPLRQGAVKKNKLHHLAPQPPAEKGSSSPETARDNEPPIAEAPLTDHPAEAIGEAKGAKKHMRRHPYSRSRRSKHSRLTHNGGGKSALASETTGNEAVSHPSENTAHSEKMLPTEPTTATPEIAKPARKGWWKRLLES